VFVSFIGAGRDGRSKRAEKGTHNGHKETFRKHLPEGRSNGIKTSGQTVVNIVEVSEGQIARAGADPSPITDNVVQMAEARESNKQSR
jgi:hypothetical protein